MLQETLGAGQNVASIYARGGTDLLMSLPVSTVEWGRARNGISEASAFVRPRTRQERQDFTRVHTWAHELVIHRTVGTDTERVWEGPIRRVERTRSGTFFRAFDVLGWLTRRAIRQQRVTAVAQTLTTEANLILTRGFSVGDYNILGHRVVTAHAGQPSITRDVKAGSGYYADDLNSLAESGLWYTVLGRSIRVWPVSAGPLARLDAVLDLDTHTGADPTIVEDGDAVSTYALVIGEEDRQASATGDDTYYGRLDSVVSAEGVKRAAALTNRANRAVARGAIAPTIVELPSEAPLSIEAPLPIRYAVPGTAVRVASPEMLLAPTWTALDAVKVTQDSAGEKVTVSLSSAEATPGS